MGLALEILKEMWDKPFYFKGGYRANIFGIHKPWKYEESSIRSTLSRLHKDELVEKKTGNWIITNKGKEYFNKNRNILLNFKSLFKTTSPKNLIVMFDIPEERRVERRWLRLHLKKFKYHMIQKSVWVGPSPLPKEFLDYIKEIKLRAYIKTFKLAKPYKTNSDKN